MHEQIAEIYSDVVEALFNFEPRVEVSNVFGKLFGAHQFIVHGKTPVLGCHWQHKMGIWKIRGRKARKISRISIKSVGGKKC